MFVIADNCVGARAQGTFDIEIVLRVIEKWSKPEVRRHQSGSAEHGIQHHVYVGHPDR